VSVFSVGYCLGLDMSVSHILFRILDSLSLLRLIWVIIIIQYFLERVIRAAI